MTEEIEIKAKIDESKIASIKKIVKNLGGIPKEKIFEKDAYFTSVHEDYIKPKTCLRVRETNGSSVELTFKGPSSKKMADKKQFWKKEINLPIGSSKKEAEELLTSMGFKKIVDVVKERENFVLGQQEISFDNIDGIGWFVEIETKVEKDQRKKALNLNLNLLKKIGLSENDIVNEPYRDIVMKNSI